jgi:hypothetical protein
MLAQTILSVIQTYWISDKLTKIKLTPLTDEQSVSGFLLFVHLVG